MRISEIWIF